MSRQNEITEAFQLLRDLCDPRGHDLLLTLENLCIVETLALDAVLEVTSQLRPSNVVSLIDRYSVKAPLV